MIKTQNAIDIIENMLRFPKLSHLNKQEIEALNAAIGALQQHLPSEVKQ